MNDLTAKEKFANFMSYVKLLIFLIVAGAGGYYFYTHMSHEKTASESSSSEMTEASPASPVEVKDQKPSEVLKPVMISNLPLLWNDFNATPVTLQPDFTALETAVNQQKAKSGKLQPAWQIASQICHEMRAICTERNAAAAALARVQKQDHPVSVTKISKSQLEEEAKRKEFFTRNAVQQWNAKLPQRQLRFQALSRQLQAAEAGK